MNQKHKEHIGKVSYLSDKKRKRYCCSGPCPCPNVSDPKTRSYCDIDVNNDDTLTAIKKHGEDIFCKKCIRKYYARRLIALVEDGDKRD